MSSAWPLAYAQIPGIQEVPASPTPLYLVALALCIVAAIVGGMLVVLGRSGTKLLERLIAAVEANTSATMSLTGGVSNNELAAERRHGITQGAIEQSNKETRHRLANKMTAGFLSLEHRLDQLEHAILILAPTLKIPPKVLVKEEQD